MSEADYALMVGEMAADTAMALAETEGANARIRLLETQVSRLDAVLRSIEARLASGGGRLADRLTVQSRVASMQLINIGMNASLGFVIASGTIAGAWEGALHGLPSVAFSQDLTGELFDRVRLRSGVLDSHLLDVLKTSARHAARLAPQLIGSIPVQMA